jgi:hypothetical protein
MTKYTIKSTSDEGVYYLVNGWNKHETFFVSEKFVMFRKNEAMQCFFNKPSHAKASLTKLLKVMPEFATDEFELIEMTL